VADHAPLPGVQRGWWLEDAVPGTVIRHPGGRTIGGAEHLWLAWLTYNISDIHGDARAAADTGWGRPLVLGMLTAAMVMGLAEPATPPPELAALVLPVAWRSIRLSAVVVPGDTLRSASIIDAVEAEPRAPVGLVRRTIEGYDQRGSLVAVVEEERTVPRRPAWGGDVSGWQRCAGGARWKIDC
jgi:acyl dehydratase